jgi:methylated-DNA-[protein]-cysteine S-methyltransferase
MQQIHIQYFSTPCGELILGEYNHQLCLCDWRFRKMRAAVDSRLQKALKAEYVEQESDVLTKTKQQLNEYFAGTREAFDLPLLLVGTDFQQRVWQALQQLSYGSTSSYLKLSEQLGDVKAIRAVASANGANAISIIVPCHRIIGSNGDLIGYAGGLDAKKYLLRLEQKQSKTLMSEQMTLDFG